MLENGRVTSSILVVALLIGSCSPKIDTLPSVTQDSRRDRIVAVEWYENDFRPGDETGLNLEQVVDEGTTTCQSWGYKSVRYTGHSRAYCEFKQVDKYYQCDFRFHMQCVWDETQGLPVVQIAENDILYAYDNTGTVTTLGIVLGGLFVVTLINLIAS